MASNPPAACCTVGVKHEGEAVGEFQQIGGGMLNSNNESPKEKSCSIDHWKHRLLMDNDAHSNTA